MKQTFLPIAELVGLFAESVALQFIKCVTPEGHPDLVPYYHFSILAGEDVVGHINLRLGETNHITLVAGHIGYRVDEKYRGNSYAFHACLALRPLIKKHYRSVIITARTTNAPSIAIIKKLGADFLNEVEVAKSDPAYKEPGDIRVRYRWTLQEVE